MYYRRKNMSQVVWLSFCFFPVVDFLTLAQSEIIVVRQDRSREMLPSDLYITSQATDKHSTVMCQVEAGVRCCQAIRSLLMLILMLMMMLMTRSLLVLPSYQVRVGNIGTAHQRQLPIHIQQVAPITTNHIWTKFPINLKIEQKTVHIIGSFSSRKKVNKIQLLKYDRKQYDPQ